jgi:6-phosphogluconolactonase
MAIHETFALASAVEQIDPSAYIAPNATVFGKVRIGRESTVLFHAVIRGDCEEICIGQRSNVQDLACLHADPGFPCRLGDEVTLGHGAIVHGATIEDRVLIGIRAVVLNGAKIGRESIIGAGAVVPEGKTIPPRSLVLGVPGKVVRELTAEDIAYIEHAAQHYVVAGRQYRRQPPSLASCQPPSISATSSDEPSRLTWVVREDPERVAFAAREWFIDRCLAAIRRRGRCLVALAGGSTPKRLYELLAELPAGTLPWSKLTLFWGDERDVGEEHPDSNFGMVSAAWLRRLGQEQPRYHRIPCGQQPAAAAAEEYERLLRGYAEDGRLSFDIVLLGLGDDAHTASLFPGTTALSETDRWVVANDVPQHRTTRITLTAPILNQARHVAFLVCGANKGSALMQVFGEVVDPRQYPAQLIEPAGECRWFFDAAAAQNLSAAACLPNRAAKTARQTVFG